MPLDEEMIETANSSIANRLLEDVIFGPFHIELQDDVIEPRRVSAKPIGQVDRFDACGVRHVQGPETAGFPSEFVGEKGAAIAIFSIEEKILKPVAIGY